MTMQRFAVPLLVWVSLLAPVQAAEYKARPKHVKVEVTCQDCHGEERLEPGAKGSDAACQACHGDMPAMAAFTRKLPNNPHAMPKAGHPAPFGCTECHHQHKAPVVKCLECHPKFNLISK